MAARKLEAISQRERQLLWVSSLQGVAFDSAVTASALERDRGSVERRLERLRRKHHLLRVDTSGCAPFLSERYEFAHVLYFDALQEEVTLRQKAEWSRRTADAILATYGERNESIAATLGQLFETAGDGGRAVRFYASSAARAVQLSAFQIALTLCERAGALARQLAHTADTARQELELLRLHSLSLGGLHGFTHESLKSIYDRAQALADAVGDRSASLFTDMAYWSFVAPDNYERGLELANQLTHWTRASRNYEYLANSGLAKGISLLHLGQPRAAVQALGRAHASAAKTSSMALLPAAAVHPTVVILCNRARALWYSGQPDAASRSALGAVKAARETNHQKTLAYALALAADVYHLRRNGEETLQLAQEAVAMSRENQFFYEMTWSSAFQTAALTALGNPEEACRLWELLTRYHGPLKAKLTALSAWAFGIAGEAGKGLEILKDAFRDARERREAYYDAELFRVRAELCLMRNSDRSSREAARRDLEEALAVSRHQHSGSLELRAANSFLRYAFRFNSRIVPAAATTVSTVLSRLPEGNNSADSNEAHQLLSQWSPV
jgi:hypothetical protein